MFKTNKLKQGKERPYITHTWDLKTHSYNHAAQNPMLYQLVYSGCKRAGHESQREGMALDECWGSVMSPVQTCSVGSLGGRTDEPCQDVGICYGYKCGDTTSVKEIMCLKGPWVGRSATACLCFEEKTKNQGTPAS